MAARKYHAPNILHSLIPAAFKYKILLNLKPISSVMVVSLPTHIFQRTQHKSRSKQIHFVYYTILYV